MPSSKEQTVDGRVNDLLSSIKEITVRAEAVGARLDELQIRYIELQNRSRELETENKRLENMITSLTKELLLTRKQSKKQSFLK